MSWTLDKLNKDCAGCGKSLAGGMEVVSYLESTPMGLARFDRCAQCKPASSESVFSFWRHIVPKSNEKPPDTSQRLLQFFDNLLGSPPLDAAKEKTAFLLALALMRKRLLKHVGSMTRDEKEIWTLRRATDGAILEIVVPSVSPVELDSLRDELVKLVDFEI